jgi:hypothetical protein
VPSNKDGPQGYVKDACDKSGLAWHSQNTRRVGNILNGCVGHFDRGLNIIFATVGTSQALIKFHSTRRAKTSAA